MKKFRFLTPIRIVIALVVILVTYLLGMRAFATGTGLGFLIIIIIDLINYWKNQKKHSGR